MKRFINLLCAILLGLTLAPAGNAQLPVVLKAADFRGGGLDPWFSHYFDRFDVNAIYAQPSGDRSFLTAAFTLNEIPKNPVVQIDAHGDEVVASPCTVAIRINDVVIFEGDAGFPADRWEIRDYPVPAGLLRSGSNTLRIENTMKEGKAFNPPWLMISRVSIGEKNAGLVSEDSPYGNFYVVVPVEKREIPEPLKPGEKPGFALRGTKGWNWTIAQTLEEIPWFKTFRFNFYMNCYTSMFDFPHRNEWWKPLPDTLVKGYEKIVSACRDNGIDFCFSLNPNFMADKEFDYDNPEHVDNLWQKYKWMADLGVKWFCVSLDDISKGLDAGGQARFVNRLLKRLRSVNPEAQMILCPSVYATSHYEGNPDNINYLKILSKELDPDVYCFYTGVDVCGPITTAKAREYRELIGHRLIIWDNYPVNDGYQTMNLGPVILRDPDLCTEAFGYMANPMKSQSRFSRLALSTAGDYAWNPYHYDPLRSIGQSILHLAGTPEQAQALADAVDLYPGCFIGQAGHYWYKKNAVRDRYQELAGLRNGYVPARAFIDHVKAVLNEIETRFPGRFPAECQTIRTDVTWMEEAFARDYRR